MTEQSVTASYTDHLLFERIAKHGEHLLDLVAPVGELPLAASTEEILINSSQGIGDIDPIYIKAVAEHCMATVVTDDMLGDWLDREVPVSRAHVFWRPGQSLNLSTVVNQLCTETTPNKKAAKIIETSITVDGDGSFVEQLGIAIGSSNLTGRFKIQEYRTFSAEQLYELPPAIAVALTNFLFSTEVMLATAESSRPDVHFQRVEIPFIRRDCTERTVYT